MMSSDLALEAATKRLEVVFGLASVADVVGWADRSLADIDGYNDHLANISLAASATQQDLASLLYPLGAAADEFEAMRSVLGSLYLTLKRDDRNARAVTRGLERFWIDHKYELPDDMQFIVGIEDDFGLAEDGIYGTREDAVARLLSELEKFEASANNALEGTRDKPAPPQG